jgi:hypothetical protein
MSHAPRGWLCGGGTRPLLGRAGPALIRSGGSTITTCVPLYSPRSQETLLWRAERAGCQWLLAYWVAPHFESRNGGMTEY